MKHRFMPVQLSSYSQNLYLCHFFFVFSDTENLSRERVLKKWCTLEEYIKRLIFIAYKKGVSVGGASTTGTFAVTSVLNAGGGYFEEN